MPAIQEVNPFTLFTYNGVNFSQNGLYKSRVKAKPVPTDSGRSVRFVEYRLEWEGPVVTPVGLLTPLGPNAALAAGGALMIGQGYFWVVTAVNAADLETTASTETLAVPDAEHQSATLTWGAVSGAVTYRVYRGTTSGGENTLVATVGGTTFTDTGAAGQAAVPPESNETITTIDNTMATLRKLLEAPAGALCYQGKGFGPLIVNDPAAWQEALLDGLAQGKEDNPPYDAAWGPWPELLSFNPLGGDGTAAWVEWAVVTRIPECDSALYRNGIIAFEYTLDFAQDEDGYASLTYAGYLEIPLTRTAVNNRSIPGSADAWWDQIAFDAPLGFKPKPASRKLSMDRRRLEFSQVFEQMPSPLPDGATTAPITSTLRNVEQTNFYLWSLSFEGSITTGAGIARSNAYLSFLRFIGPRLKRIVEKVGIMLLAPMAYQGETGKVLAGKQQAVVLPTFFSFSEEITGRSSHFSQAYLLVGVSSLKALMASQLWTPVDQTYQAWKSSLANSVFSPRGSAKLAYNPSAESIIDLCVAPQKTAVGIPEKTAVGIPIKTAVGIPVQVPTPSKQQTRPEVDPSHSWIFYRTWFEVYTKNATVVHKPLRKTVPPQPKGSPGQGGGGTQLGRMTTSPGSTANLNIVPALPSSLNIAPAPAAGRNQNLQPAGGAPQIPGTPPGNTDGTPLTSPEQRPDDPADILQKPVAPDYFVRLYVIGLRAAYPIPVPNLLTFGGSAVTELGSRIRAGEWMRVGGTPIYFIKGYRDYRCVQPPEGTLPTMGNPQFDVGG